MKVIPLGVDSRFRPMNTYRDDELNQIRDRYHLPMNYLLYVGRLNVRKNIRNLLLAMLVLPNQNIQLVVVGEDNWKTIDHKALTRSIGLSDRVLYLGSVPDVDLPIIYALARVFCFPSYAEGFGLPAIEAMASGVPVVVASRTALPEVCGQAGNYVNPDEPEDIAKMITHLLNDHEYWSEKREAGLKRAALFRWQRSAEMLLTSIRGTT